MFPFGHTGEISFQASENERDLVLDNPLLEAVNFSTPANVVAANTATTTTTNRGRGRGRGRGRVKDQRAWVGDSRGANDVGMIDPQDDDDDDKTKMTKKMMHRDIERQRRNEMSSLFSSLCSLLPPQYLKGKRSMCDHVTESVNYIKDLQNNIQVLGDKRDDLKPLQAGSYGEGRSASGSGCNVEIYSNAIGLQVQIVTCQGPDGFALSNALRVLHDEGLDVVNCVSNTANGNFFHHNIQCQVNETTSDGIDIEQLQQRLYDVINN